MTTIKRYIIIFTALGLFLFTLGLHGTDSDKDLFDKARLALFDGKWDLALSQLNQLHELYPNSAYYQEVFFYKGKCFQEKKMLQKALDNYTAYLGVSQNESLKEEATVSIIDLNFTLYEKGGGKEYLDRIAANLENKNQVVRYYAALTLSKAREKTIAALAIPILKKIIAEERDEDLVDRAKIALMRIDPKQLKKLDKPGELSSRMLVIQSMNKDSKKETFSLSIPFVLAQLALESLPQDAKKALKEKGYEINRVIDTIIKTGEILRIESEDTIVKIWIK